MHNVLLIARREYVERVRSKAFVIMTILIPVLMAALTVGPSLLAVNMLKQGAKHYVVVVSRQSVGDAIQQQLSESQERETKKATEAREKSKMRGEPIPSGRVTIDVDTNTSAEEQAALTERIRKKE